MNIVSKWIWNILIAVDQLGNALTGGDPDETISSRLGKVKRNHGGKIPFYMFLPWALDKVLDKIDYGHTEDAIEEDEGSDAVFPLSDQVQCPVCAESYRLITGTSYHVGDCVAGVCGRCKKHTRLTYV